MQEPTTDRKSYVREFTFKVALVGNEGTGKSSILNQFIEKKFSNNYVPTLGVNLLKTKVEVDNPNGGHDLVNLMIWDIAGQRKYEKIRPMYFQGCRAVILVYDITRPRTFEAVKSKWLVDFKDFAKANMVYILVGNKKDLVDKTRVGTALGYQLASEINATEFIETSAKTGENIERMFYIMINKLIK
jgi:Ras-related protein Rab-11A